MDSYGKVLDPRHMGAVYGRITPNMGAEKPDGAWQSFDITLVDHHVTVVFNDKKIIDNQPVLGPTFGALCADVLSPGPVIYKVTYRNIVLTSLK